MDYSRIYRKKSGALSVVLEGKQGVQEAPAAEEKTEA